MARTQVRLRGSRPNHSVATLTDDPTDRSDTTAEAMPELEALLRQRSTTDWFALRAPNWRFSTKPSLGAWKPQHFCERGVGVEFA